MADTAADTAKGFEFFYEILHAFREAASSAKDDAVPTTKVEPFLKAMTMFLRIFDAFANPFFADVVKKDVQGNITKLRAAAAKLGADTLGDVLDAEMNDNGLEKSIRKENSAGGQTGTVALLWMKRMMQFVTGLLVNLTEDAAATLSSASRASYAKTLRFCHNFVTRGVFDTGLRFVPARDTFYRNLANGAPIEKVEAALKEFIAVFEPQLKGIDAMYRARDLEPLIKV